MLLLVTLLAPASAATLAVPDLYPTVTDAMAVAVDGDEIVLSPGSYCEDVDVTVSVTLRAEPPLSATLDGTCANGTFATWVTAPDAVLEDLVLDGAAAFVTLGVNDGASVEGRNLRILNGSGITGGGVHIDPTGSFTCTGCEIVDSTSTNGGGVYNTGHLELLDSVVCGNSVTDQGGGIFSSGSTVLRRTAVVRNHSVERGGGVYLEGNNGHQVHNTVFLENTRTLPVVPLGGVALHVGDAADVRNSIFVGHAGDFAVDNDDEANTGGYNLFVDNLDGDASEPYPFDVPSSEGSVAFVDVGALCAFDLTLDPLNNPLATGTGDPLLAGTEYPNDLGLIGGASDDAPDEDGDHFADAIDCLPSDPVAYPGAVERCNGLDDDCYQGVPSDEVDHDGDAQLECEGDCAPQDGTIFEGASLAESDVGDGIDRDCNGLDECFLDADDDGVGVEIFVDADAYGVCVGTTSLVLGDCDDADDANFPGNVEICDSFDNNCDGLADDDDPTVSRAPTWYEDGDLDGYGGDDSLAACLQPGGYVDDSTDCDDVDGDVFPGAVEICDGIDNDCDGFIDDEDDDVVGQDSWYLDDDGDTFGDASVEVVACEAPVDHVDNGDDCDDTDDTIHPAAAEVCDGYDNNCDAVADDDDPYVTNQSTWFPDVDHDGQGDADGPTEVACGRPVDHVANADDCDDTDVNTFLGATEQCDGADNDCDTEIDEDVAFVDWYPDDDTDGFGDPGATPVNDCVAPANHVANSGDCDDDNPLASPGIPEIACDGIDNDCDPLTSDDVGCDTGTVPADADTDADTDSDTDTDADTDADSDTDTDTDTDADTDTNTNTETVPQTETKAPAPADPDYGCGCSASAPGYELLHFLTRRRS